MIYLFDIALCFCSSLKEFLPKEYLKVKGAEKKIYAVSYSFFYISDIDNMLFTALYVSMWLGVVN